MNAVLAPPHGARRHRDARPGVSHAPSKRAQQPLLEQCWSLAALGPRLPLRFPVPSDLPPSPKRRYRAQYRPPDPQALRALPDWSALSDFEVALALIDFSPLEPLLAQQYAPSAKGQTPFHPVSLFLCLCLRRELGLGWRALARLLASDHGRGWRVRLGFADGQTPSASGLRYCWAGAGAALVEQLCPQSVALLRQHGLFPERSTYPGDPPERGITVSQDGMLHPARSRPSCQLATDACSQPVPLAAGAPTAVGDRGAPSAAAGRPCRARERGGEGCPCDTPACQTRCRRASRLDPQARLIHYAGRPAPRHSGSPATPMGPPSRGTDVFGYRSVAERALDDRFAVAWTLRSGLYPATADERTLLPARVQGLQATFPDLRIGEWLDDAGVGYGECLETIWQLGALRLVDIRADPTDQDPQACLQRGYDGHGRPLCPHGYALRANGFDAQRRRTKYLCAQACRRVPLQEGQPVQPVPDCPYLDPPRPLGLIVNVGRTLPDGSLRLAREIPHGSARWQARYGRRNLSESRNGQLEGVGLKRLPAYGLARNTQEIQLADFLLNLRTLGRLVRQASSPPNR